MKPDHLGKLEKGYRTQDFLKDLKNVWDNKRYKDKKRCKLFQALIRTNIWRLLIVIISSFLNMGLDIFQVILFREYIRLYELIDKDKEVFTLKELGLFFLASKILSSFISKQIGVSQVTIFSK